MRRSAASMRLEANMAAPAANARPQPIPSHHNPDALHGTEEGQPSEEAAY